VEEDVEDGASAVGVDSLGVFRPVSESQIDILGDGVKGKSQGARSFSEIPSGCAILQYGPREKS
jgi:hypothetical protein